MNELPPTGLENPKASSKSLDILEIEPLKTKFLRLTNITERKEFHSFCKTRSSLATFLFVTLLLGAINITYYGFAIAEAKTKVIFIFCLGLTVLVRVPMILYCFIRKTIQLQSSTQMSSLLDDFLHSLYVVTGIITTGLSLFARVQAGECEGGDFKWSCNSEHMVNALPQEHLFVLMVTPVLCAVVFRSVRWECICLLWTLAIAFTVLCIVYFEAYHSIPCLLLYVVFSLAILCENQKHSLHVFYVAQTLKAMIVATEHQSNSDHESEMRSMMGNVAHDLKTPLAAFLSGVEDIFATATDCSKTNISEGRLSGAYASSQLQLIIEQVENIREVNSFMTMTINRCIDFTKTSTGVKLTAHHETVGLDDTLRLPVKIMKGFQNKINIQLNAIPRGICTQVITDKQWLQENILCLLSNAVKYSAKGTVTISVKLVRTTPLSSSPSRSGTLVHTTNNNYDIKSIYSSNVLSIAPPTSNRGKSHGEDSPTGSTHTISKRSNTSGKSMSFSLRRSRPRIVPIMQSTLSNLTIGTTSAKYQTSAVSDGNNHNASGTYLSTLAQTQDSQSTVSDKAQLHALSGSEYSRFTAANIPLSLDPSLILPHNDYDLPAVQAGEETVLMLKFEVQDTGIGMSDEAMSQLFTPFRQAMKWAGGTGLGLFSLKQRIDALKGRYGVTRRRDGVQGSMFWFAVPYSPDELAEDSLSPGASFAYPAGGEGQPPLFAGMSSTRMLSRHNTEPDAFREEDEEISSGRIREQERQNSLNAAEKTEDEDHRGLVMNELPPSAFERRTVLNAGSLKADTASPSLKGFKNLSTERLVVPASPSKSVHSSHSMQSNYSASSTATINLSATQLPPLNILMADDALTILKMTSNLLRRRGHLVETADNGSDAIDKILTRNLDPTLPAFHVVLMDLQMPIMDGLEAMRRIRASETADNSRGDSSSPPRHQVIIALSANPDDETRQDALAAGADAFMCKPFTMSAFDEAYTSLMVRTAKALEMSRK